MKTQIITNPPPPQPQPHGRPRRYPFGDLAVGEALEGSKSLVTCASYFKRRNPGWNFTSQRLTTTTYRIYRSA